MEPIIHTRAYEAWAPLIARVLLAIQLSAGAFFKVVAFQMQVDASAAVGIPFPTIAVALAFVLEVAGVLALLFGYRLRPIAAVLAVYVAVLAVLFYNDFSNPMNFGMFMSHLGMIAALLYVSVYGAKSFALRKD